MSFRGSCRLRPKVERYEQASKPTIERRIRNRTVVQNSDPLDLQYLCAAGRLFNLRRSVMLRS